MSTTYTTYPEKPTMVNIIAWTTLASGIVNLGWGLAFTIGAFFTIIGICCTPLTILPAILGVFEIIYAAKLLSVPPQPVRPAVNLAILEIVCILTGNVFSMAVGIISLIFYNDPAVKGYFARLNGPLPPEPVAPVAPIPPVVPIQEEPIPSPIGGEAPVPSTAPAEESPVSEPEPPEASHSMGETIVSPGLQETSAQEDPTLTGMEPPEAPDEPQRSDKAQGE